MTDNGDLPVTLQRNTGRVRQTQVRTFVGYQDEEAGLGGCLEFPKGSCFVQSKTTYNHTQSEARKAHHMSYIVCARW